jgi:hypothetical protein
MKGRYRHLSDTNTLGLCAASRHLNRALSALHPA